MSDHSQRIIEATRLLSANRQVLSLQTRGGMDTEYRPVIIITGCSGFLGKKIINRLASSYRIVGLDIKEPIELLDRMTFFACDFTKDESVASAFRSIEEKFGHRIASCIHLAAYYDFSGEPNRLYKELTVKGTLRLRNELQRFHVEQLIFSSSLLVMKPAVDSEKITEQSATAAKWDYPRSKLETEKFLLETHDSIPLVILRIAGVYDDYCNSIPLAHHIQRIHERDFESYFFPGDPAHGQSFVHGDDVAECVKKTIEKRNSLGPAEIFLIGEEELMSHRELQNEIGSLLHEKAWPTIRIPRAVAKAGAWLQENLLGIDQFIKPWMIDLADDHYPVEVSKASRQLGWHPVHSLRDTLPQMVRKLKENPHQWYEINNLKFGKKAEGAVNE